MGAGGGGGDRAQLWALYFGVRAMGNPPPFVRRFEAELRQHLAVDGPDPDPPALVSRGHLRRLK